VDLASLVGSTDIYLLDQILRGHIPPGKRVLDAGCGGGRNLTYFLQAGYDICALDPDGKALARARSHAERIGARADATRFRCEAIEETSFPDGDFDVVVCNAVLHFARDEAHFEAMAWRLRQLLRPGGLCFTRLASTVGIEDLVRPVDGHPSRWFHLPDGSTRFLVDIPYLVGMTDRLGVALVDPIKTVNVQGLRCMSNWVWRRPARDG
jgi:SAM-dependent methyltransferase